MTSQSTVLITYSCEVSNDTQKYLADTVETLTTGRKLKTSVHSNAHDLIRSLMIFVYTIQCLFARSFILHQNCIPSVYGHSKNNVCAW